MADTVDVAQQTVEIVQALTGELERLGNEYGTKAWEISLTAAQGMGIYNTLTNLILLIIGLAGLRIGFWACIMFDKEISKPNRKADVDDDRELQSAQKCGMFFFTTVVGCVGGLITGLAGLFGLMARDALLAAVSPEAFLVVKLLGW